MEYKEYELGELIEYRNEKLLIENVSLENYISTENLLPNRSGKQNAEKLPNTKSVKKYYENDILISNIRPYFKKIWQAEIPGGASNDVLILNSCSNKITNDYLYYYLSQDKFFDYMTQTAKGTKMPRGDKKAILDYEIKVPNIKHIQNYIVNLGKNIDKKIETNKKIIANLEELSQTLFKRWFVDFEFPDKNGNPYKSSGGEMIDSELGEIPLNWKCSKIKDINVIISDHVANGSFKSLKENLQFTEDLNDKYAVFARNVDLKKGNNRFEKYVTKSSYEFLRKSHLHGHEVIISNVGDVGSVYLSPILNRPMVLGNNQIFINSDEKSLNYYFYLFFKSSIGKNLIDSITSGSVQMKFNKTDLRNSLIVFPCKNDMNNLITVIKKYIYSIENKKSENMQLIQLRDTLLPKLMSGEIEVPDDIEVNEDELSI